MTACSYAIGCTKPARYQVDGIDTCRECYIQSQIPPRPTPLRSLARTDGVCRCGCGAEVRGQWKQGHNARQKGTT